MSKANHSTVCIVGMFPPPIHGMSLVTEFVRAQIAKLDMPPYIINLSPKTLDRSITVRLGKVFRVMLCLLHFCVLLLFKNIHSVYTGLSGGNGQIYDAVFVGLSRVLGKRLYLHHHGYLYLNQFSKIAQLLVFVAGKNAVHIVACEKMASDLKRIYPTVTEVRIISGIVALEQWSDVLPQRKEVSKVGFISNISIEKGILDFLELAKCAEEAKLPVHFQLAGPFQDVHVKKNVEERISLLNNITYIGAIYTNNKLKFFDSIDVFVLPSRNESEGLVLHEAMSRGIPVIAYSTGCIEQIVSDEVGLRVACVDDLALLSLYKIKEWQMNPSSYQLASSNAFQKFNSALTSNKQNFKKLCTEMLHS